MKPKINYLTKLRALIELKGRPWLFKEPAKGQYRTGSMFIDAPHLVKGLTEHQIYCLSDFEEEGRIPLRQVYMEIADPTEYRFATECFYNFEHYRKMLRCVYFKKFIDSCRDELEMRLRSQSLTSIAKLAKEGNFAAAKFIVNKEWIGNKKERELVNRTRIQNKQLSTEVDSDMALLEKRLENATK